MNILHELKKNNYAKKIKLRAKLLDDGSTSLYLDVWHNRRRQYQFLKIYLDGRVGAEKADLEKIRLASMIRDQKELEMAAQGGEIELHNNKNLICVSDYISTAVSNKANYHKAMAYLFAEQFPKLTFRDLTRKDCEKFYSKLCSQLKTNSASLYYSVFYHLLNVAKRDGLIKDASDFAIKKTKEETKREFLTEGEVQKLRDTPCVSPGLKDMFLFCCHTGLRFSDAINLTNTDIREGILVVKMKKTRTTVRVKLTNFASGIVQSRQGSNRIFGDVNQWPTTIRKQLTRWIEDAGITKHITFHCARHTFATLLISSGVDLYTVSKLLGHSDISTTQVYAKLIDKVRDEAIDKLPEL